MKTLRQLIASLIDLPRSLVTVSDSLDNMSANLRESNEAFLMTLKSIQEIRADMERCQTEHANTREGEDKK